MTDIVAKALALLNEVKVERGKLVYYDVINRNHDVVHEALCRAIEQHEAFKQKVSDAVEKANTPTEILCLCGRKNAVAFIRLDQFIIPKPDPLADVLADTFGASLIDADELRAALEARGLEIREKGQ